MKVKREKNASKKLERKVLESKKSRWLWS